MYKYRYYIMPPPSLSLRCVPCGYRVHIELAAPGARLGPTQF